MERLTCPRAGLLTALLLCLAPTPIAHAIGPRANSGDVPGVPLTISMSGTGHVTSDPAGIDCTDGGGTCTADFSNGTSVTLAATPPSGETTTFPRSCGASSSCGVEIGVSPLTVDVLFADAPTFYLLVTGGGEVQATPLGAPPETAEDGINTCNNAGWTSPTADTCRLRFAPGRRVQLEVVPNGTNSTFIGWSDPSCSGQSTCTVVMPIVPGTTDRWLEPYDLTVAASFGPVPIGILADVVGGGTVSSIPPAIHCTFDGDVDPIECVNPVEPGTTLTLHADNPLSVYWDPRECEPVPLSPAECTIHVTTSVWLSLSLGTTGAPFRESSGPEVLIRFVATTSGSGSGRVSGGSIDCGNQCTSDYAFGRLATFTATPDPGSRFAGWRGGGCASTETTCTLTVGAASGITAAFEPITTTTTTTTSTPTTTGETTTTAGTTPPTPATPTVTPTTVTASTKVLRVRLVAAASIQRGRRRTLLVRLTTTVGAAATITVRGPQSLVLHRSYRLEPPRPLLHLALPARARAGHYRLTITLTDAIGRTRTLRPTIDIRQK